MLTKKYIQINKHTSPIRVEYSNNATYYGDTVVTIYDEYKISLVLSDDCGAVIGDKVYFPKRGDIMIFRPSEVHFGRFPKESNYQFISFFLPVDFFENNFPDSKDLIVPFLDESESKVNWLPLMQDDRNKLISLGEDLLTIIKDEKEANYYDILAFAKLVEALDLCARNYVTQKKKPTPSAVPALITKTIQKLDEHFPGYIGLDALAGHCDCSVTYLTQTFRRYTGKSIHNYLTQRRLEHARRLLQNGASVTEACYQSGFSDCSGFITLFKKHFGVTPGKYNK